MVALARLTPTGWLLFLTRCIRLFAYGLLSVVLALYLKATGLTEDQICLLISMTLVGDTAISLWITMAADRWGRRRMLFIGALLMAFAGLVFALTTNYYWLLLAATVGIISPSGNEVGPFLSIEQAALAQTLRDHDRTAVFAWYNLAGSVSTAVGAAVGGAICQYSMRHGTSDVEAYTPVLTAYAALGLMLALSFTFLSPLAESQAPVRRGSRIGLHVSRGMVLKLSGLFALDAFGGGFIVQTILAYWVSVRFGVEPAGLGTIFGAANLLAASSALLSGLLARRIGLLRTMVLTHLPSHVLLMLMPLMPNLGWLVPLMLLRYAICQMDVPTRQSYLMAVVAEDERSAAAGVTTVARSLGAALAPVFTGYLLAQPHLVDVPLYLAGIIKTVYDLCLYRAFSGIKPPEERQDQ